MSFTPDDSNQVLGNISSQQPINTSPFDFPGDYASFQHSIFRTEQDTGYPLDLNGIENPMIGNNEFIGLYTRDLTDQVLGGNTDQVLGGNTDQALGGNTDQALGGNTDQALRGNTNRFTYLSLGDNTFPRPLPNVDPCFENTGIMSGPNNSSYNRSIADPQPSIALSEDSVSYFNRIRPRSPGSRFCLTEKYYEFNEARNTANNKMSIR